MHYNIVYIMLKTNIKITIFCQFLEKYYRNISLYFDLKSECKCCSKFLDGVLFKT